MLCQLKITWSEKYLLNILIKHKFKSLLEGFCRSDRTRHNGFKLKYRRFRVDIRKKFFTMRMVRHCKRLPRDIVDALSLVLLKVKLNQALSNLIYWKMSMPMAGRLELDGL